MSPSPRCAASRSSRPYSASTISTARLPGPRARSAATRRRPQTAAARRDAAAAHRTPPRAPPPPAPTPAQPMAVTRAISGSPLAMRTSRAPSVTTSVAPVSGDHAGLLARVGRSASSRRHVPASAANSAALSRIACGRFVTSVRAKPPAAASGRRTPGRAPRDAAAPRLRTAISVASRRSRSKVPRLTSSASARATKAPTSSGATVIEGWRRRPAGRWR